MCSFSSHHLIQTNLHLLALHGTAMRGCGMIRGTKGTGAEVHPEKEDPGVVQVDQVVTQALPLGEGQGHTTNSRHGGTSLTSPHGASGSLHFLHVCRQVRESTIVSFVRCQ